MSFSSITGGDDREVRDSLIHTTALALWLLCTAVGIVGLCVPYPRERPAAKESPPVVAQMQVQLPPPPPPEAAPVVDTAVVPPAPREPDRPPPPPQDVPIPEAPPLAAVAAPSPAIAFPVPVQTPAQIVEPKAAPPPPPVERPVAPTPAPAAPAHRHLQFGVGEGNQPNPDYPRQAVLAHQQGSVTVRFTVNEAGRVIAAEIATPSRWPLLNQAAVEVIRQQWRFKPGPVRSYDITIQFELTEQ